MLSARILMADDLWRFALFGKNIVFLIVILVLLIGLFNLFQGSPHRSADMPVPYSTFLDKVESGDVKKVTIEGSFDFACPGMAGCAK